jgi:hypothetical protein
MDEIYAHTLLLISGKHVTPVTILLVFLQRPDRLPAIIPCGPNPFASEIDYEETFRAIVCLRPYLDLTCMAAGST